MRKTLAILLCAVMMVSILCVGASAAKGTAINTAADFAAMNADGDYYLNADIKIDATYMTAFKGTFDGNGHKVTISVPMFAQLEGTVKNLTIEGTELKGNEDLASVALFTYEGMTAINVTNKVNITVTGLSTDAAAGLYAGGILANADPASMSVFFNCKNYGDITIQTVDVKDATKGIEYEVFAGGIAGRVDGLDAKYCENHGMITAPSNRAYVGGIAGRATYFASYNTCDVVDCTNAGLLSSGYDAGGMVGNIGVASNNIAIPYNITNCVNTAEISGGYRVGGFVGYCYAGGTNAFIFIVSCVNTANVKGGRPAQNLAGEAQYTYMSLFIGYSNSPTNKIVGCLAVGELLPLTGDNFVAPFRVIMGCSSAKTPDMPLEKNYICDNDTTEWYSYATGSNSAQQITLADGALSNGKVTRCTLDEVKNGSVLEKLNAAADSAIFSQKVGTDLYPTMDLTLREKRMAADLAELEKETEPPVTTTSAPKVTTTEPKVTTKAPGSDTETDAPTVTTAAATTAGKKEGGCGSLVGVSFFGIALLAGVVFYRRKED